MKVGEALAEVLRYPIPVTDEAVKPEAPKFNVGCKIVGSGVALVPKPN